MNYEEKEVVEENSIVPSKKRLRNRILIFSLAGVAVILAVACALMFFGVIPTMKSGDDNQTVPETTSFISEETTDITKEETTSEKETTTEETTESPTAKETETTKPVKEEQTVPPVEETTKSSQEQVTTGKFTADFKLSNSWDTGSVKCYQFELTVSNKSTIELSTWNVSVSVPAGCKIQQSWNCNCSISGNTLKVSPADYNAVIAVGSNVTGMGIIFECSSEMKDFSYTGTASGTGNTGGNTGGGENETIISVDVEPYVPPVLEKGTPVGNHGQLSVKGTNIVDKDGKDYQLKGVSTHGIQWFPQYVNKDAFKTLRDNWGANMVRIAMYTDEGGYCQGGNKAELEALVSKGVEACTELGMYVIIDWHILHDGNPNTYKADAISFFDKMSKKYSNNVNVIYEICNEPNGGVDWNTIKAYANEVIPVIRKNSPNALIIVGTPTWSQDVDMVVNNQVANPKNVLYAVHFYAATHGDNIRNKVKTALAAGIPVFISEFSICDASGNGGIDYNSANVWKELINSKNLSYAGWSLSNKNETSALLSPGCSKTSGWDTADLSATGIWLRNMIAGK